MIELVMGGRQSGRTTQLIRMCAEAEKNGEVSYIVTRTLERARDLKQKALELGLHIELPFPYHEFMSDRLRGFVDANFFIDDADHFLQYLAGPHLVKVIVLETPERMIT